MAKRYSTFRALSTVKAYKVTDKGGEDVVTSAGPQHASAGDYIVLDDNGGAPALRVLDAGTFESTYGKGSSKAKGKPSPNADDAAPVVAGTNEDTAGTVETPADPASVVARVKATEAQRKADS